ncbi:7-cyano-7-deazaguanine synthase [Phycisphaerae bacterium RAS1]|nr:7-cyano-7-deazaguanine synthase [Phycisphaerae bacterium RAS1]
MSSQPRAIVLLSGGLDSATALALARADGFDPLALSFRYGQRHAIEIDAARRLAAAASVREHKIVDIDLRTFGGSALTDDIPVPKDGAQGAGRRARDADEPRAPGARRPAPIPITYVPARNTIFLSFALALAEVRGARDIYIGVNAVDYSGYPDCRPEYVQAFEKMANLATRAAVTGQRLTIHTPLINLTKAQIITRGLELGVDYSLTRSCYDPDPRGAACGRCESCTLRLAAFAALRRPDPAPYAPTTPS